MILLRTFFRGLAKVFRYWQIVVLLAVVQIFAAWLLAAPLASTMHHQWDHSLIGSQLTLRADMKTLAVDELIVGHSVGLQGFYNTTFMFIAALGYILFNIWVIAGALRLYSGLDLKFNWDRFWSDASRFFRPFIGLAIIAAAMYFIADTISVGVNNLVADSLRNSNDEAANFLTGIVFTGALRFLLFYFVLLVFDYAKAISAAEQLRNVLYVMRSTVTFVSRNFFKVLVLFAILGLLEFGITALDVAVWQSFLTGADQVLRWGWLVLITLLLTAVKLGFLSCQLVYYVETSRRESESGGIRISSNLMSYSSDV